MSKYANVIVDISHEKLDKTFQYGIPSDMEALIRPGVCVDIPFGNRTITGYVIELTDQPELDPARIKPLIGVRENSVAMESGLIELAAWIKRNYGSTMNQALKTVIPVKKKTKEIKKRYIYLNIDEPGAIKQLALFENKHQTARARLLRELMKNKEIDYSLVTGKLAISPSTIRALSDKDIIGVREERHYRNPVRNLESKGYNLTLNQSQQAVVDEIEADIQKGRVNTYLIKGVTGSGKTEVYMELIYHCLRRGKQAILLIPEISLTYQTVMRFYNRFGDRISVMNSRMSQGERYDQFERAKNGDIDIMIGPRSALYTPFSNLGLIIIDEEHENSYKSETMPRYHAREVAIEYGRMNGAPVVLGSATPSVDSYYMAQKGDYKLLCLDSRVNDRALPECEIVDLREELKSGNRSILSLRLQELMEDRLQKGQQTMLFINRRGLSGFMSCRACGYVVKCPHCDVSLSQHNNGRMVCHYCGYEEAVPHVCPSCGSKYISGFKAGTQKVEEIVQRRFPHARILRMDYDTTRTKDSYEKILSAFANREADILIGTQMIVKGHDFSNVTLVGVLAADMSLHVSDFHGAERTFQLITQAAGRAGRGDLKGNVIIQTYDPDNYAIVTARNQDYDTFYQHEIEYRQMMFYPPVWNLLMVMISGNRQEENDSRADMIAKIVKEYSDSDREHRIYSIGPADAAVSKVNDVYRKVLYIKTEEYDTLVGIKDRVEGFVKDNPDFKNTTVQFDFNPISGF